MLGVAAGPRPVLRGCRHTCGDRIIFDVGTDVVELFGRAHPVVEGFILPERLSLAGKDGVGLMGTRALDSVHYARNGDVWRDQEMNVIGHHYKSVEGEVTQGGVTFANDVHNGGGDGRFL